MSGIISGGDFAFGSQLIYNSRMLKQQYDTLTLQSSTGTISPTFAGLGAGASTALRLAPQIAQIANTQTDIDAATTRIQSAQTVMSQLTSIATQFENSATLAGTSSSTDVAALAGQARDALGEVVAMLNTQSNGVYLFGGEDTSNPPVPDPSAILSSNFFTSIQTAVAGLATAGTTGAAAATATEAATLTAATTNSPFSTTLGTQVPTVDGGNGQQVGIGIIAGQNLDAVTTGDTTGSYMLDLVRSLATLGSLDQTQANAAGFSQLATDTATALQNTVTALSTDSAVLGSRQDQLTSTSTQLGSLSTALSTQLSNVQDTDITQTATRLTLAQTQLQASYQLIADLKNLSLVDYL